MFFRRFLALLILKSEMTFYAGWDPSVRISVSFDSFMIRCSSFFPLTSSHFREHQIIKESCLTCTSGIILSRLRWSLTFLHFEELPPLWLQYSTDFSPFQCVMLSILFRSSLCRRQIFSQQEHPLLTFRTTDAIVNVLAAVSRSHFYWYNFIFQFSAPLARIDN